MELDDIRPDEEMIDFTIESKKNNEKFFGNNEYGSLVAEGIEQEKDIEESIISDLVLNYLSYHCFSETAAALACSVAPSKESKSSGDISADGETTDEVMDSFAESEGEKSVKLESCCQAFPEYRSHFQTMEVRRMLMSHVREGKIDEAVGLCCNEFPGLLGMHEGDPSEGRWLYFQLLCLKFVELIRVKDSSSALLFAQSALNPFGRESPKFLEVIQDVVALLAYEEPEKSPVASFLQPERRDEVATTLNKAVLSYKDVSPELHIDILLKDLAVVMGELNVETENKYSAWSLNSALDVGKQW